MLDVQLRGSREGLALSHELHASLGVRSLLVTANCPIGRIAKDCALGCLSKPFSPSDLVESVKICEALLSGEEAPPHHVKSLELF